MAQPQPPKYESQIVEDFSAGLNTLYDPRALAPARGVQESAESPFMDNIDIVSKGAIITSQGYTRLTNNTSGGGVKSLFAYIKDGTTQQMLVFIDSNMYYFTAANPLLVSGFGLTQPNFVGIVSYVDNTGTKRAYIGTDNNVLRVWDGASVGTVSSAPAMGYILESFKGHLWLASGKVLYYSATNDQNTWTSVTGDAGTISFDDDVTGMRAEDEFLIVYTHYHAYTVPFTITTDTGGNQFAIPSKHPSRTTSGCLAYQSVVPVYNDMYAFSPDGIQRFGSDAQFIASNLRVNSLSWKINPSLLPDNYNSQNISRAAAIYFHKKFYFTLPYGTDNFNSQTFIYNYDYNSWASRSGILASNYAILPDVNGKDELYFANPLAPYVYKFYGNYDYNGVGYKRAYTTKIFTMGDGMRSKFWQWIDIKGAMYQNTVFFVDLTIDGMTKTYYVDYNALDQTAAGGYYGDDYYGSQYYGGPNISSPFKRFGARIPFPVDIRDGRELQITFRNQDPGEPWKIDYLNIMWSWDDITKVPYNYQSPQLTTT